LLLTIGSLVASATVPPFILCTLFITLIAQIGYEYCTHFKENALLMSC
jgi:hypothetical protein